MRKVKNNRAQTKALGVAAASRPHSSSLFKLKGKCNKVQAKSFMPTHSYCTRFRLRCIPAVYRSSLSSQKVVEFDHAAENQSLYLYKKRMKMCLPNDIMFNVLVFLPAKIVFEVMRYVCWEWFHMVKEPAFVNTHLQVSPIRVLLQFGTSQVLTYHVEGNNADEFAMTVLDLPFRAKVCSSLDGLILLQDQIDPEGFYIVNLVTRVEKSLPPFGGLPMALFSGPSLAKALKNGCAGFWSTLARTTGGQYKVVCVAGNLSYSLHDNFKIVLVCTVGVDDAWRVIENTKMTIFRFLLLTGRHTVVGFVFWFLEWSSCSFAFDVDAEIMFKFYPPHNIGTSGTYIKMMKTMGYVSFIYSGGDIRWCLWELTDVKSSKWSKVFDIDMGALSSRLYPNFSISRELMFRPHLYLTNGELWISLRRLVDETYFVAVYNINSGNLLLHERGRHSVTIYPYVNSLVKSC